MNKNRSTRLFPKIARGHDWRCLQSCINAKTIEAHFTERKKASEIEKYVDGHYTDEYTARRAHEEGYR